MLFHTFRSQEDRRDYGGSAFIEIQFCRLPAGTRLKKIVSLGSIQHWQNDSLYVDDEDLFFQEYKAIFNSGIYHNLKSGVVDIFGINYYAPEWIDPIIHLLNTETPTDYEVLSQWLGKAKEYNGFYILGI